MDTSTWIIIGAAALALVIVIACVAAMRARRRHRRLRDRFGPEYDHAVESHHKQRTAERDLMARADERDHLDIRPLSASARERYATRWAMVQTSFVDSPESAVRDADVLVRQVLEERGYPVDGFDHRSDLVSVDYPHLAEDYRTAHDIAQRNDRGDATTDDQRNAFVRYRSLFDHLLEPDAGGTADADRDRAATHRS
jgi:hypothetical protein